MADADDRDTSLVTDNPPTSGDPKAMSYDIDLIKNNPLTKVIIKPNIRGDIVQGVDVANTTIEGWCANDSISINGESAYSSDWEDKALEALSLQGSSILNRFNIKSYPTFKYQAPIQTVKAWSGTSAFSIDINLFFIASGETDDVTKDVAKLLNLVYPIRAKGDQNVIIAPMGHQASLASADTGGLCSLKIGTWFEAPPFFVCKRVTNDVVVRTKKDGKPLYAKATISLESHQAVMIGEIRSWIHQSEGTPTSDITPVEDGVNKLLDVVKNPGEAWNDLVKWWESGGGTRSDLINKILKGEVPTLLPQVGSGGTTPSTPPPAPTPSGFTSARSFTQRPSRLATATVNWGTR